MNIFAIEGNNENIDWIKSAQSQDNYRVVKMILESAQMLCCALNELSGEQITPYRSTHKNHPSSKWVRESSANFDSLVEHTMAMLEEYTERFGKIHKCSYVVEKCLKINDSSLFLFHEPTKLPLTMPYEFQSDNIVDSYRKFYASKPRIRYPKDKIPVWFPKYRGDRQFDIV